MVSKKEHISKNIKEGDIMILHTGVNPTKNSSYYIKIVYYNEVSEKFDTYKVYSERRNDWHYCGLRGAIVGNIFDLESIKEEWLVDLINKI